MTTIAATGPEVVAERPATVQEALRRDVPRLAAAITSGAVAGFVIGGVGSRLAMMLIAALNRDMTGRLTDDGAVMGRFDLGETAGLVLFTTILGVVGGLAYLALRDLVIGPPWFRAVSITIGPAVVVGSMLVHRDGVDFTLLEPAALSIALFVAIPGLYAALVSNLTERWMAPDARLQRAPLRVPLLLSLPLLLLWPLAVMVALAWSTRHLILHWAPSRRLWLDPARQWVVRAGLTVVFVLALWNLVSESVWLV